MKAGSGVGGGTGLHVRSGGCGFGRVIVNAVLNCCSSSMLNSNCSSHCSEAASHFLLSPYQIIDKSLRTLSSGKELRGGFPVPSRVLEPACMWVEWLFYEQRRAKDFPKAI